MGLMSNFVNQFIKSDFSRFKQFWFRGIWRYLPFVIVSKKKINNMYFDIADHAIYYTVKNFEDHFKTFGKGD